MERNLRKTRVGLVTSDKMDKTIVVSVTDNVKHPLYNKIVKRTYKLKAHDENNECRIGDRVKVKVTAVKDGKLSLSIKEATDMMAKEIEEFLNLAITEHMGKAYTDWKLKQQTDTEPDKVEEEYEKVIVSLSPEQEEAITKYCDAIFNSGADTEEFFYRLGLKDGMKLKKCMKQILKALS